MPKKRNSGRIVPNVIRIFCEGEKTEPLYIRGYIESLKEDRRRFVVEIDPTRKNTPIQLVDEAVGFKKSSRFVEGDLLWAVYDRESPAKYSDDLHARALQKAEQNGVKVALSNVCFEFWLLLHLKDTQAPYTSYDEFKKQSEFRKLFLKTCHMDYDKAAGNVFELLKGGLEDARQRAKALTKRSVEAAQAGRSKPFQLNPYTNLHELLDDIDTLG
jgi:hypothetical protein